MRSDGATGCGNAPQAPCWRTTVLIQCRSLLGAIIGRVSVRLTDVMEYLSGAFENHSGLMFVDLITLAHFSVSSAISLPNSAGEPPRTVPPRSASRAFILGSARPALISLLSLSTIAAGVFSGAPTRKRPLAS